MVKMKLAASFLASALFLAGQYSYAADVALEGKILAVENDGTMWMEVNEQYNDEYKIAINHALQDYTRIHYNMLRFHVHGQEIGFESPDPQSPHAQVQKYAATLMKEKFTNKPAFAYCVEINQQRLMPSCIVEIEREDVSIYLLNQGFSEVRSTKSTPKIYLSTLKKAEDKAKDASIGIWSSMQGLFGKTI